MKTKIKPSQVMTVFFIALMTITIVYAGISEIGKLSDSKIVEENVKEKLESDVFMDYIRSVDSVRVSNKNETEEIFKTYYTDEKRIILEDDNYNVKLNVTLDTKYEERVPTGDSVKFAEMTFEDYTEFDDIELYSISDDYEKIEKNITLKYKTIEEQTNCYTVPANESNLSDVDSKSLPEEICNTYNITTYTEFDNVDDLPSNNITIGLFTNTIEGEHIEWIIVKDGFRFYEWASYLVTDLVAYYKLDETSGTTAYDSLGNYNGTNTGATVNKTGKIGQCYDFENLNSDYINLNNGATLGDDLDLTGDFTISAWINLESFAQSPYYNIIVGKRIDVENYQLAFRVSSSGKLNLLTNGGVISSTGTLITTGSFYHVVVTRDNDGNTTFYLNGNSDSSSSSLSISHLNTNLYIGRAERDFNAFDGKIDEVGIWSRALNATEVSDLYNNGIGFSYPFEPPTYCNFSGYVFDENSNPLSGSNITIWNQYDISEYHETSTNASGYWNYSIENSTNTYMIGARYNGSTLGPLYHDISGTC